MVDNQIDRQTERVTGRDIYNKCLYLLNNFGKERPIPYDGGIIIVFADTAINMLTKTIPSKTFRHWGNIQFWPDGRFIQIDLLQGLVHDEIRLQFDKIIRPEWARLPMSIRSDGKFRWKWTNNDQKLYPWATVDGINARTWIKKHQGKNQPEVLAVLDSIFTTVKTELEDKRTQSLQV